MGFGKVFPGISDLRDRQIWGDCIAQRPEVEELTEHVNLGLDTIYGIDLVMVLPARKRGKIGSDEFRAFASLIVSDVKGLIAADTMLRRSVPRRLTLELRKMVPNNAEAVGIMPSLDMNALHTARDSHTWHDFAVNVIAELAYCAQSHFCEHQFRHSQVVVAEPSVELVEQRWTEFVRCVRERMDNHPLVIDWSRCLAAGLDLELSKLMPDGFTSALVTTNGQTPRLHIRIDSHRASIVLDGEPYEVSYNQAVWVKALADAKGNWISGNNLDAGRVDRLRKGLPKQIQALIDTKRGTGARLTLPKHEGNGKP